MTEKVDFQKGKDGITPAQQKCSVCGGSGFLLKDEIRVSCECRSKQSRGYTVK